MYINEDEGDRWDIGLEKLWFYLELKSLDPPQAPTTALAATAYAELARRADGQPIRERERDDDRSHKRWRQWRTRASGSLRAAFAENTFPSPGTYQELVGRFLGGGLGRRYDTQDAAAEAAAVLAFVLKNRPAAPAGPPSREDFQRWRSDMIAWKESGRPRSDAKSLVLQMQALLAAWIAVDRDRWRLANAVRVDLADEKTGCLVLLVEEFEKLVDRSGLFRMDGDDAWSAVASLNEVQQAKASYSGLFSYGVADDEE